MLKHRLAFLELLLSLLFVSILIIEAKSQKANTLSSIEAAKTNAVNSSLDFIGTRSSLLFNGKEYLVYRPLEKEHPYLTVNWLKGTVDYDGDHYSDVFLLYDIDADQLITKYLGGDNFRLVKPFIASFTLGNRKFVQLRDSSVKAGFYEILSDHKFKVYAKREKIWHETAAFDQAIRREFEERTRYLLLINGSFIEVNNKKSLLQVFAPQATALKQFIREKKLKFKSSVFESTLVQTVAFCEQLP
jgi:hypothetical protein